MTPVRDGSIGLSPGALPAVAAGVSAAARQLAVQVSALSPVPAMLVAAMASGDSGPWAATGDATLGLVSVGDAELLLHVLRALVLQLLALERALTGADAAYTAVEAAIMAQLRRVGAAPRAAGPWQVAGHDLTGICGLGLTLGAEVTLGVAPHAVLALVDATLAHIPEGPGWAAPAGPPQHVRGPTGAGELLRHVTAAQSEPGQLELTHVTGTDRWIVALPGIHSALETPDPQDLPGAAAAFASHRGAYARSVVLALTAAGVPVGSKLLIVGHSQGGIVAADLAGDAGLRGRWQITDVLTAASPVHDVAMPAGTQLLALRNADDVVPSLDLSDGAPAGDETTVVFNREQGSIGGNHDLSSTYIPFADSPALAANASAQSWLAHARPYLTGAPATTQLFALRDRPP